VKARAFLLDTNVVCPLLDVGKKEHSVVHKFFQEHNADRDRQYICPIVWGEIEYGFRVRSEKTRLASVQEELKEFMMLEINRHTSEPYAQVRAELFRKYAPKSLKKTIAGMRPEDLMDETNSKMLGIQENDLWIVACAIQHNVTLVTFDKMERLREVALKVALEEYKKPIDWELLSSKTGGG